MYMYITSYNFKSKISLKNKCIQTKEISSDVAFSIHEIFCYDFECLLNFVQMEIPVLIKFGAAVSYTNIYLWERSTRWCKVVCKFCWSLWFIESTRLFLKVFRELKSFSFSRQSPPDECFLSLLPFDRRPTKAAQIPQSKFQSPPNRLAAENSAEHMIVKVEHEKIEKLIYDDNWRLFRDVINFTSF